MPLSNPAKEFASIAASLASALPELSSADNAALFDACASALGSPDLSMSELDFTSSGSSASSSPHSDFLDDPTLPSMVNDQDLLSLFFTLEEQQQQQQGDAPDGFSMHTDASSSQPQNGDSPSSIASPPSSPVATSPSVDPSPPSSESSHPAKPKKDRDLECFNCHVTKTPLWRRTPDRKHPLCNACGLYYKQYGSHRPLNVRNKTLVSPTSSAPYHIPARNKRADPRGGAQSNPVAATQKKTETLVCVNCSQTQTPLWRKNDKGQPICNACGLYARLHHRDRPITLCRSKIQKRRRDCWREERPAAPSSDMRTEFSSRLEGAVENQEAKPVMNTTLSFLHLLQQQLQQASQGVSVKTELPSLSNSLSCSGFLPDNSPASPPESLSHSHQPTTASQEDGSFLRLLACMDRAQMEACLVMLERRCDLLRTALVQV
ncbi:uncharacterized protein VTP21DRAFT_10610 [Calcarisporiella thermophila]|uniref:uncharacterized protein n=1 Tax=Calcarisporiella thermophila TaxID=911321 RepID=UPI003743DAC1